MGITTVKILVANPGDPRKRTTVECIVDSGAIFSVISRNVLKGLDIKPLMEETYALANGGTIRRRKGIAQFRLGRRVGGADVVFGERGDSNLLGTTTLEALGLALDPLRRCLKPVPLLLLAAGAAA